MGMIEEAEEKHAEIIRRANSIFMQGTKSYESDSDDSDGDIDDTDPLSAIINEAGVETSGQKDYISELRMSEISGDLDVVSEVLEEAMMAGMETKQSSMEASPVDVENGM